MAAARDADEGSCHERRVPESASGIVFLLALIAAPLAAADAPPRALAVTIDDLPAPPAAVLSNAPEELSAMTARLIGALAARRVPAVGFVNGGKVDLDGEDAAAREARIGVLRKWTAADLELGNHTYSHHSLNKESLEAFEADVLRGEPVVRGLLGEFRRELRWFRHPYLQVGLDLAKRRAFERFLAEHGYRVAPVTIDNDEWIFAALYARALRGGDEELAERIAAAYLDYMVEVFDFFEKLSRKLFDREPPQILLVHANELNSSYLGDLLDRVTERGYRFVRLEEALADPVWNEPDGYVGAWGISWIHHWEVTRGLPRTPSPDPPKWILEMHEAGG